MRLTKKELMSAINQPMCFGSRLVGKKMFAQIIKELCEYKTVEEEFGIDLLTFSKAFKNGVYAFNKEKHIVKGYVAIAYDNGDFENYLRFVLPDRLNCDELLFKDCGKTWALTKEELL